MFFQVISDGAKTFYLHGLITVPLDRLEDKARINEPTRMIKLINNTITLLLQLLAQHV